MNWWSRSSRDVETPSEKLSLRGHYHVSRWSVPCVIHSRKVLAFFTRLVFTVTIFTGFGVIFASVWFMLDCRHNFRSVQALIPGHSSFCTNLGMQALFACCVLLFTIFGLGCIGRRMTGHAILIISGVAIFQGAMTLVFYQCRAMADDDIVKAVHATLESCRRPGTGTRTGMEIGPPFASLQSSNQMYVPGMELPSGNRKWRSSIQDSMLPNTPENEKLSLLKTSLDFQETGHVSDPRPPHTSTETSTQRGFASNKSWHSIGQLSQDLKRKLEFSLKVKAKEDTSKAAKMISIPLQTVDCEVKSAYFVNLAKSRSKKEVETCQSVCKTYRNFCFGRNVNTDSHNVDAVKALKLNNKDNNHHHNNNKQDRGGDLSEVGGQFRREALACGDEIAGYVRHFCVYDNRIFTPLSLGTPIFYMFMSFCFIYLAHCDRQIKDDDVIDNVRKRSRSRSSSSRRATHAKAGSQENPATDRESSNRRRSGRGEEEGEGEGEMTAATSMPSPAVSDVSSNWGGDLGLARDHFLHTESDASPQMSLPSSSARTVETYLGDD